MIIDELDDERLRRSSEHRVENTRQGSTLLGALVQLREVSVPAAFVRSTKEPLGFEIPENGEDGGIGQRGSERGLHLGHGAGFELPQHGHYIELSLAHRYGFGHRASRLLCG